MSSDFKPGDAVAQQVQRIPRSGIREFFDLVQGRPNIISLGVGEPDFVTPWHIRESAIYALERGHTSYTSNLGLPKLRAAISGYVAGGFGVSYEPETQILVSVGVSEALDIALRAIINPGDEIIYHEPCYVSYAPGIALAHGVPVVATPLPAVVDLVERSGAGIVVPFDDPTAVVEAVSRLDGDDDLRGRCAAAGRQVAAAHDWTIHAPRFVEACRAVAGAG